MKTFKQLSENIGSYGEVEEYGESVEMALRELHFIQYAAEEIVEYIKDNGECEEWFKNKLTSIHARIQDLHSYIEGEKHGEE